MPTVKTSPMDYLYYSIYPDKKTLYCSSSKDFKLLLDNYCLISQTGFKDKFKIPITCTTPCSSMSGFSFSIQEIENDLYDLSREIHPIYTKVKECYSNYESSVKFMEKVFEQVPSVRQIYEAIDKAIFKTHITPENREDIMKRLQVSISQLAAEVFKLPDTKMLPVAGKQMLNYLIFNAITSKSHFKFVMAYNQAFAAQDAAAQKYMYQHIKSSKVDKSKMQDVALPLHNILHLKSPCDQIVQVANFFNAVVACLPGTEIAADDILPAICYAMTLDLSFASHVVSFFAYLSEIWPSTGLDEKYSYILVTCSIASQHISNPPPEEPVVVTKQPSPTSSPDPKRTATDQETIAMLEDLISQL